MKWYRWIDSSFDFLGRKRVLYPWGLVVIGMSASIQFVGDPLATTLAYILFPLSLGVLLVGVVQIAFACAYRVEEEEQQSTEER